MVHEKEAICIAISATRWKNKKKSDLTKIDLS
jgi:hypothetical protein